MRDRKVKLKVDRFDFRLLIRAVADLRNLIISQNSPTKDVNALLIRLCDLADK